MADLIIIKNHGLAPYYQIWQSMKSFTHLRDRQTPDELWQVQHYPVFTQGQAGRPEHILAPGDIPVIHSDRGGQVTYHGPGQAVIYLMIDLRRKTLAIRELIDLLEDSVIDLLQQYNIVGHRTAGAPGIFVANKKICSLGLRVRKGCSYHGISFNIDMDVTPYQRINPCGYKNLPISQLTDFNITDSFCTVQNKLTAAITNKLGYTNQHIL